jgi:hypothetical protein
MLEKFTSPGRAGLVGWRWTIGWSAYRKFGFERTTVYGGEDTPYLTRNILYLFGCTIRLHKFWRGDNDDFGPHNHPWWFITIPLRSYLEEVYERGVRKDFALVKRFRPHFRPAGYEHIVRYGVTELGCLIRQDLRPFYTIVISGGRAAKWGFWPEPGKFVYWRDLLTPTGERKQ